MYLDDITLGGSTEDILHDLRIIQSADELGLHLNSAKSEIICHELIVRESILTSLPGACVIDPQSACLLGSPLGNLESISSILRKKIGSLVTMGARLQHILAHDAILLLRNSLAIPKLLYILRTSPCFLSPGLKTFDDVLKSIVSSVANIHLVEYDLAWTQATLPRVDLVSSVQGSLPLLLSCHRLLLLGTSHHPMHLRSLPTPNWDSALSLSVVSGS